MLKLTKKTFKTPKSSQKYVCRDNKTLKKLYKDAKTFHCVSERRFVR